MDFFQKRFAKIATSLYPFLIVLIVAFILFDVKFRVVDAVLNFFFLGWVAKLPGNGHLWFLTVLMMCYVMFFLLSRYHGRILNRWWSWVMLGALAVTCLILVESRGLPGHAFITLYLTTLGFSHAGEILERVKQVPFRWMFLQFVIIVGTTHLLFLSFEVYCWCRPVAVLLNNLCGISLLFFLLKLEHKRELSVLTFLSGISFELYLVHHGFCQGFFSVFQLTDNYFLMLVLLVIVSITCAYILKQIANSLKTIKI